MPMIMSTMAFFASLILGALLGSLEVGFLLGILCGIAAWHITGKHCEAAVHPLDNPPALSFDLAPTEVYSTIKQVLTSYHFRDRRWALSPANREELKLHAYCQWVDSSHRDDPFPITMVFDENGRILRQILLDVHVVYNDDSQLTDVHLRWQIQSPLYRGDCHIIQRQTTCLIASTLWQKANFRQTEADPSADGMEHEIY